MSSDLARRLAALLPAGSGLQQLIDAAEAAPPTVTRADVEQWANSNRAAVVALVVRQLPAVPGLADGIPTIPPIDGWHPRLPLGPAAVTIDCPAATIRVGGHLVPIGVLPPSGATVSLDAGPARGSGSLALRPDGASGSLMLRIGVADVVAFANLVADGGPPSLAVVLGVRFVPPVQLSFGFALTAVGGLIAINHELDADALRARLGDGSVIDALFPTDPQASHGAVLATLGQILRPRAGHHVVGPTATITWLDLGAFSVVRLDVAVLLSLPSATVTIVGRGQVQLPPVLQIRLDVLGVIDTGRSLISIDAVLVDSHLLGIFDVTGTAALRMSWGDRPYLVITIGGFYPGFRPEPALLPPQRRLAFHLGVPAPITLRAEGYLAITANTVQAGAKVEAGIDLSVISAGGELSFDAIVTFDPFHVHADYRAEWRVSVAIFEGGTTVSGWIDGPGPWKVHARVSVSLLIDSFDWSDTFTIGSAGAPPPPAVARISDALGPQLDVSSRFAAASTTDPHVEIVERPGTAANPTTVVVSPLADLAWTQDLVPLGLPVRRVGGKRLASEQLADISIAGAVVDEGVAGGWFAPTVFTDLTSAESLGQPTYQHLPAGRRLALQSSSAGDAAATLEYVEHHKTADGVHGAPGAAKPFLAFDRAVLLGVLHQGAAPVVTDRTSVLSVRDEAWSTTIDGAASEPQPSAIHALLSARRTGGIVHAAAERPIAVGAL